MTPDPKKIDTDDNFNLIVEFADGQVRSVNIKDFLLSPNEIKTNLKLFKTAYIEDDAVISWSNGVSLDPEVIYLEGQKINKVPKTGSFISRVRGLRRD